MKTIKMNLKTVSCLATVIAIIISLNFTYAQNSSVYSGSEGLLKAKTAINKDLASINQDQSRVQLLQNKLADEHKAKQRTCDTKADLRKANADLSRQKVYLKEDKDELMREHQAFIKEQQKFVTADKARLRDLHSDLRAELYQGNANAVSSSMQIVNCKHDLKVHDAALKQAMLSRNNDLLATNDKIKSAKAESPATLAFEDGAAKVENRMLK